MPKFFLLLLLLICTSLAGCEGEKSASVDSLTKPLPSTPTPTPNPNATDLKRVAAGTLAPDFTLEDMKGRTHKLSQYRGQYAVLVFYRGYFWTHCQEQLGKLKTLLNEEEKKQVQILAISQDTPAESRAMEAEIAHMPGNLDFPLLSDAGHRVIDAYGIANPAEFKAGIPYPAVYLIGQDGMVMHRFLDAEGLSRATNEQIREQLKMLGALR